MRYNHNDDCMYNDNECILAVMLINRAVILKQPGENTENASNNFVA